MSEWQPIETAPKDGTRVLLWDGDVIGIGEWIEDTQERLEEYSDDGVNVVFKRITNNWGYWGGDDLENFPTHWISLPTPPESK